MKKGVRYVGYLFFTSIVGIITASLFGILHDQISYTLCNEYYTKFKFPQFGFDYYVEIGEFSERVAVTFVGVLATWWVGLFIGIINGLVSIVHLTWSKRFSFFLKSVLLVIFCTALMSGFGYLYGKVFVSYINANRWFPDGLVNRNAFIAVGSMHNASYTGGLIGLVVAIYYHLKNR